MDAQVLNEVKPLDGPPEWVSSQGIRFGFKPVPRMIIVDAVGKIKDPKVPMVMDPDKGRVEENPNDPDYLEELSELNIRRGKLTMDIYLAMGARVLELPEDIEPCESDAWIEALEEFGLEIPRKGRARFVAWMKYYALSDDDLTEIMLLAARNGGATVHARQRQLSAGVAEQLLPLDGFA